MSEKLELQALSPGTKVRVDAGALGIRYEIQEIDGRSVVNVTAHPVSISYHGTTVAVIHRRDFRTGTDTLKIRNDETGEEMMYMYAETNMNRNHITVI